MGLRPESYVYERGRRGGRAGVHAFPKGATIGPTTTRPGPPAPVQHLISHAFEDRGEAPARSSQGVMKTSLPPIPGSSSRPMRLAPQERIPNFPVPLASSFGGFASQFQSPGYTFFGRDKKGGRDLFFRGRENWIGRLALHHGRVDICQIPHHFTPRPQSESIIFASYRRLLIEEWSISCLRVFRRTPAVIPDQRANKRV